MSTLRTTGAGKKTKSRNMLTVFQEGIQNKIVMTISEITGTKGNWKMTYKKRREPLKTLNLPVIP